MPFGRKLAATRKRKSTTQPASECKRQRLSDPPHEADFWDSLSKIWLTKHALREFDRRIKLSAHQNQKVTRPRTRAYLRKSLQRPESIEPATVFLEHCPLRTLQDIKSSARQGGPDLTELRGYPEPAQAHVQALESSMSSNRSSGHSRDRKRGSASSSRTKPSTNSTVTERSKKSLPGDANYHQKLVDGKVLPYGYKYPDGRRVALPPGWEDLNKRLAQPRPSLSPSRFSEDKYHEFVDADASARKEARVKDTVLPSMMRAMSAANTAVPEQLFNTDPIVEGIARPTPDYYYGAPHELIHREVRQKLRGHILPSDDSPAVPNFSMEAKGPRGDIEEGMLQACHYGAIGARAMQSMQTYGEQDPAYDNHVRTISSLYHGGTLKMYGHSVAQPGGPGTRPEYYMHQIDTWGMTGNQHSFLRGATAYKNAMELTTDYRNAAIERANAIASRSSAVQEESEGEDEGSSEDGVEVAEASDIYASFMANSANSTSNAPTEDDEDDDENESETSIEADHRRPPAKRSSTKSQSSSRRRSHKSQKSSCASTSQGKQRRSWFGW